MSESTNPKNPDWHTSHGEHFKSLFDYFKHISTLATGSILLIATFVEKLFKAPQASWCVGVAVGALFVSLIASLAAYSVMVLNFPRNDRPFGRNHLSTTEQTVFAAGLMLTWLSFLVGIGSIAYFFLRNWYAGSV